MDCEQTLVWIHHYMDGGLPQWRMLAMTRHLDDCPPCMDGYRLELHFRNVVATKCTEQAPYNLRQRIEEALACLPPPPSSSAPVTKAFGDLSGFDSAV
jgi:mycothiol system anti-sigma-R factor